MVGIVNKPDINYGIWASNGDVAVPSSEKVEIGHIVEKPKKEIVNWIENRQDQFMAYLNQVGIPEWDSKTTYKANVSFVNRSGTVYKAKSQNIDKDPTPNQDIWEISWATYSDFYNLRNRVDNIETEEGYLDLYVSKANPVFGVETKGVGYGNANLTSSFNFNNDYPSVKKDDEIIAEFSGSKSGKDVVTYEDLQDLLKSYIDSMLPIGAIIEYSSEVVPTDNLMYAHGQAIKRSDYPELFSVIGTRYGIGDGATTFNLPDKRGLFTREWDNGKGIDAGRSLGSKQEDLIEAHQHIYPYGEAYIADAPFGYTEQKGFGGVDAPKDYDNHMFYTNTGEPYLGNNPNPSGQIGSETRPKNIAMVSLIRVK